MFSTAREDQHASMLVASLLMHIRDELQQRIDSEAAKLDGLKDQDIANLCDDVFSKRLNVIRKRPHLEILGPRAVEKIDKKYVADIARLKKKIFGSLPMKKGSSRKLTSLVVEMLCRHYFGPMQGGLVFAGFGRRQFLPSLITFEIEEFVLGKPRIIKVQDIAISDDNAGSIVPFAQQEMVHAFMEGVDRELMNYIESSTNNLFTGAMDALVDHVGVHDKSLAERLRSKVAPIQKEALGKLFEDWTDKRERFWQPVLQIVASLPKDELAAMAEALVNLTKFRRRVTTMRETVGGPIDVAVITKGDGFIWIKRKHYFRPELNPRIIARYGGRYSP